MRAQVDVNPEQYLPRFGLNAFRPGQREVIATVLAGRDCLCVMPTGGGKSLCYQLPALALPGLTLVVSPLIALMKDQVDQLSAHKLPVTFINSTISLAEQYDRLDRMASGEYRLVYVVPERFRSQRFLDAVGQAKLSLLAVDEAHCISEWGHDFRPDYARLGQFRRRLGNPTTIALTATATDAVRRDIVEQLALHEPRTFITGFARPNLFYEARAPRTEKHRQEMLLELLSGLKGSGIIYAASRKKTDELSAMISTRGRRAIGYHAGMLPADRKASQEAFMEGRVPIVVATTAFGMGIDKRDVRFVIHYNLPGTLEGYYQEAGRAGRDGLPSRCLLLYHTSDRIIQEFFIESAYPEPECVATVYDFLRRQRDELIQLTQQEIKEQTRLNIGNEGVGTCEQLLEGAGVLERLLPSQNQASVRLDSDLPTLVDLLPQQAKARRRVLQAVEQLVGSRRQEMVHFSLRDLMARLDMEPEAVQHALRELNSLKVFTYIPPFRGRAIRMLQRDVPFEKLNIDFEELRQYKAAEYEKLNGMVRFALSEQCRQQQILTYFGDEASEPCGHCDNCQRKGVPSSSKADEKLEKPKRGEPKRAEPVRPMPAAGSDGVIQAVRIALSGVARTEQRRFPCGKNLVAQMLWGSKSKKVSKLGLHKLSTFGLLERLAQTEVVVLLDALLASGHLDQKEVDAYRPVIRLTDAGRELMLGHTGLTRPLPLPDDLVHKIEGLRFVPAGATGPSTAPAKVEPPESRSCNLGVAQPPSAVSGESAQPRAAVPPSEIDPGPMAPSYYWTWRLLAFGFTLQQCVTIRNLPWEVLLDHALRAAEEGRPLAIESCLPEPLLAELRRVVGDASPAQIRVLLPDLPPGTLYEEVQLYLACRRAVPRR